MPLTKPQIEELLRPDRRFICDGKDVDVCVQIVAVANLPTRYGKFQIVAFYNSEDDKDHVALVKGDVFGKSDVLVRLHSECLTGEVFDSLRCDCHDQFVQSIKKIASHKDGVLLYMRQEGRGIGLTNKIKAYQLQDYGFDTFEANKALGYEEDARDYRVAAHMLMALNVHSIKLLTNNPSKIIDLERHGIKVTGRIPLLITPNKYNRKYLKVKYEKSCHMLDDLFDRPEKKQKKNVLCKKKKKRTNHENGSLRFFKGRSGFFLEK
jgi:GTP cyclohydrolase II